MDLICKKLARRHGVLSCPRALQIIHALALSPAGMTLTQLADSLSLRPALVLDALPPLAAEDLVVVLIEEPQTSVYRANKTVLVDLAAYLSVYPPRRTREAPPLYPFPTCCQHTHLLSLEDLDAPDQHK